jgi:iron complex transport system permease protein
LTLFIAPALNALTLGEEYAISLGVNLRNIRRTLLMVSSLLTAMVIAFCGPIAFIGIISPHLLRIFVRGNDHYFLIPLVFLTGGALAIIASFCSLSLPWFQLPLNAILGLFGAPILFFILTQKRMRGVP